MKPLFKIFIQNEAGSKIKNRHDEKTLEYLGSIALNEPYPFPYGFILETATDDGDNVDCYVFTQQKLSTNTIVECNPIGLLELFENSESDHKILAVLPWDQFKAVDKALDSLRRFYEGASKQFPTTEFKVGDFLPEEAAMEFIVKSSDDRNTTS